MSLRVSGWLTRFWLTRKTRQIQDDMSHSRVFSWRRVQTKNRTCNFVSLRIQLICHFQFFSFGEVRINKIGTLPCSRTSTLVEHGGFVGKVNNTTFPTGLCLRVGKHKGLVATTKLCRNAVIQRMHLEPFDWCS